MAAVGEVLARKVGPMPLGAWLLVGAGGLYIAWRSSQAEQGVIVEPTAEEPLPTGGGFAGADTIDGAPIVLSPIFNVPSQAPVPVPAPVPAVPVTPGEPIPPAPPRVPVKTAPKPAAKAPRTTPAHKASKSYTVRSGDTLSEIAARYHVPGGWSALYRANKSVIDSTARRHGKAGGGHWIFPGTRLTVPQ